MFVLCVLITNQMVDIFGVFVRDPQKNNEFYLEHTEGGKIYWKDILKKK